MKFDDKHVMLMKEAFKEILNIDDQPIIKDEYTIISEAIGYGLYYHKKKQGYKLFKYTKELDLLKDKVLILDEFDEFKKALIDLLLTKSLSKFDDDVENIRESHHIESEHVNYLRTYLRHNLNFDERIIYETNPEIKNCVCFINSKYLILEEPYNRYKFTIYKCVVCEYGTTFLAVPRMVQRKCYNITELICVILNIMAEHRIDDFLNQEDINTNYQKILRYKYGSIQKKQQLVHRLLSS